MVLITPKPFFSGSVTVEHLNTQPYKHPHQYKLTFKPWDGNDSVKLLSASGERNLKIDPRISERYLPKSSKPNPFLAISQSEVFSPLLKRALRTLGAFLEGKNSLIISKPQVHDGRTLEMPDAVFKPLCLAAQCFQANTSPYAFLPLRSRWADAETTWTPVQYHPEQQAFTATVTLNKPYRYYDQKD